MGLSVLADRLAGILKAARQRWSPRIRPFDWSLAPDCSVGPSSFQRSLSPVIRRLENSSPPPFQGRPGALPFLLTDAPRLLKELHLCERPPARRVHLRLSPIPLCSRITPVCLIMGDYSNYGGSDEENAEIRKLNAEVVSPVQHLAQCLHLPVCLRSRLTSIHHSRRPILTTSNTGRSSSKPAKTSTAD